MRLSPAWVVVGIVIGVGVGVLIAVVARRPAEFPSPTRFGPVAQLKGPTSPGPEAGGGWPSGVRLDEAAPDAWLMPGRDAARTHASLVTVRPPLRERWRVELPFGGTARVRVVAGPHVLAVAHNDRDLRLWLLDSAAGRIQGLYALPTEFRELPWLVLARQRLWAWGGRPPGPLVYLDIATGRLFTVRPAGSSSMEFGGTTVSVPSGFGSLTGDPVLQPLAASGALVLPEDAVYSLDRATPAWQWPSSTYDAAPPCAAVTVAGQTVIAVPGDTAKRRRCLSLLDAKTGRRVRSVTWPIDPDDYEGWGSNNYLDRLCAASDRGPFVFTDSWGRIGTISMQTIIQSADGHIVGRLRDVIGLDASSRGLTYGVEYRSDMPTNLVAISVADGSVAWRQPLERYFPGELDDTALLTGEVLWLKFGERLVAFRADTGDELGGYAGSFVCSLVAADGAIYVTEERTLGEAVSIHSLVALEHDGG